ncbi:MAG: MFS transporter [Anaerovoracaceae bacterium]
MKGSGRIRYEYNGQQGSEKNTEDHSDSGGDNSVYHHLYWKCAESVHPGHKRGIGISAGNAGWLITGYTLAVTAFSVPMGRLADVTCMKPVLAAGIAVFTLCCGAAVFSGSFVVLMISRMVQGIGAAMIFSTNVAVLISAFPQERRGQVLGYSLASTYAGLSAGPVVGGILDHVFGWRSIFIFTGVLGAAALAVTLHGLPSERRDSGEGRQSLDVPGNLLI